MPVIFPHVERMPGFAGDRVPKHVNRDGIDHLVKPIEPAGLHDIPTTCGDAEVGYTDIPTDGRDVAGHDFPDRPEAVVSFFRRGLKGGASVDEVPLTELRTSLLESDRRRSMA